MERRVCKVCKQDKDIDQYEEYHHSKTRRRMCYRCLYDKRKAEYTSSSKRFIERMVSQLKSGRKRQGIEFNLDAEFFLKMFEDQDGRCAVTGRKMTWQRKSDRRNDWNISIDRIDPKGQYEPSNVRLVCKRVNLVKHNMTDGELKDWSETIFRTLVSK
jgi:hypothetical protein